MTTQTRRSSETDLSAQRLVNGTAYAMEQAWHLLKDAVLLFQRARYPLSLVAATFCLEQLGRAEIYREKAKLAATGQHITFKTIRKELTDHLAKLERAQIPVAVAYASSGEPPPPGSPEAKETVERFAKLRTILEQRAPSKALCDRLRALHVDHIKYSPGWNRPTKVISRDDADYYLSAAEECYRRLRREMKNDKSEVGRALWNAIRRLELPNPPWDIWTWKRP